MTDSSPAPTPTHSDSSHKDLPSGAIQGICTAAAGAMTISMAFIGFWAFQGAQGGISWEKKHLFVLIPFALTFCLLACVPLYATRTDLNFALFNKARFLFLCGVFTLAITIVAAIVLHWFF
ncbi:hypothetical protein SR914_25260 [Comamonas testosteroni]|uniref:hypothetical protein n=1 Tax=Comamonas testosteroni TaxID=285 RepID=UPI0000E76F99|nr:hypothetical protein [Comamonas testosteroni]WQG66418.1 hypothetical protein SR914_25260 [Comamonas testosteroni]